MKIKVHLRIVGLFFSETVEVEDTGKLSIKDVMDAYIAEKPLMKDQTLVPRGLGYTISAANNSLDSLSILSITHNYDGTYEEKDDKDACGRTIGGKIRAAGTYRLQELVLDPVIVAWQSYVIDATTKENRTKTKPGGGFTSFNNPKNNTAAIIKAGDTIIWRMVAIVRRPNVFEVKTSCKLDRVGYSAMSE